MIIPEHLQKDCLIFAFRYALGRQSMAPLTIVEAIEAAWPELELNNKRIFIREIRHAIEFGNAGMDCDIKLWKRILELPQ